MEKIIKFNLMFDERFTNFGSEVEGMRDESHPDVEKAIGNTHLEEFPDVNEIVLKFNTELAHADLNNSETFSEWRKLAEFVREHNPEEGNKMLGMIDERLKELGQDQGKSISAAA